MFHRRNYLYSLFWCLSPYFRIACYLCFSVGHYQLTSHLEDEDFPVFHLLPPLSPLIYILSLSLSSLQTSYINILIRSIVSIYFIVIIQMLLITESCNLLLLFLSCITFRFSLELIIVFLKNLLTMFSMVLITKLFLNSLPDV